LPGFNGLRCWGLPLSSPLGYHVGGYTGDHGYRYKEYYPVYEICRCAWLS